MRGRNDHEVNGIYLQIIEGRSWTLNDTTTFRIHFPHYRLEKFPNDKRSSLFLKSVIYGLKKFYNIGPKLCMMH